MQLRYSGLVVRTPLQVEDVNDNAPQFQNVPQLIYIRNDVAPGTVIFRINITDMDSSKINKGFIIYITSIDNGLFKIYNSSLTVVANMSNYEVNILRISLIIF